MIADNVWAKIGGKFGEDSTQWMNLHQHLQDTAGIARILWDGFWSEQIKHTVSLSFDNMNDAKNMYVFLSGIHDVGKCSPGFESMAAKRDRYDLIDRIQQAVGENIPDDVKNKNCRHECTGYIAFHKWLVEHGASQDTAVTLATIIGGHHGVYSYNTLEIERLNQSRRKPRDSKYLQSYGYEERWINARDTIISEIYDELGVDGINIKSLHPLPLSCQSILTGMVIVADWMASNQKIFPLNDSGYDTTNETSRVKTAWDNLGLPTSWSMKHDTYGKNVNDIFHDRFNISVDASVNSLQEASFHATDGHENELMIIEAPMGIGKTEAALLAAEQMALRTGAGGLVFALPTQATANGIFPRLKDWITNVSNGQESLRLLHGGASLNSEMESLRDREWKIRTYGGDHDILRAPDWFNGSKQGMLSNFVVCTIDQVLMAALQQKHIMLRHAGLAGKVIIVDEVHASDTYMEVYMERALEWLSSMGCGVILLSATLDKSRRDSLISAYALGRNENVEPTISGDNGYPLISSYGMGKLSYIQPRYTNKQMHINIRECHAPLTTMMKHLLIDGGCAAIIHNTVSEAQHEYEDFIKSGWKESEILLFHSRFLPRDRKDIEDRIIHVLGKNGKRPYRLLVIATQTIEQSLDIDFDVMVSDLAPIDLLLQRAGRLHRHDGVNRPENLRQPTLYINGFHAHADNAPDIKLSHAMIYGKSRLIRSNIVILGKTSINIPSDIPVLVNDAMSSSLKIPHEWNDYVVKADNEFNDYIAYEKNKAAAFLLRSPYSSPTMMASNDKSGNMDNDEHARAAVRDSTSGLTVIALKLHDNGYVSFLNDDSMTVSSDIIPGYDMAKSIEEQKISLPYALSNIHMIDRVIDELEKNFISSWQSSPLLQGELVLFFDESGNAKLCGYDIHYDIHHGLSYKKSE